MRGENAGGGGGVSKHHKKIAFSQKLLWHELCITAWCNRVTGRQSALGQCAKHSGAFNYGHAKHICPNIVLKKNKSDSFFPLFVSLRVIPIRHLYKVLRPFYIKIRHKGSTRSNRDTRITRACEEMFIGPSNSPYCTSTKIFQTDSIQN